jgi:hypothetical protein
VGEVALGRGRRRGSPCRPKRRTTDPATAASAPEGAPFTRRVRAPAAPTALAAAGVRPVELSKGCGSTTIRQSNRYVV